MISSDKFHSSDKPTVVFVKRLAVVNYITIMSTKANINCTEQNMNIQRLVEKKIREIIVVHKNAGH